MAVLDVDELKPDVGGVPGRLDELLHEAVQIAVQEQSSGGARPFVEHRMLVGHERSRSVGRRTGKTPGVGQLEADAEVLCRAGAEGRFVFLCNRDQKIRQVGFRVIRDHELIRIGTSVGAHRDRFAPPDQFRAARPEMSPPAHRQVGRSSVRRPIPSFHWQDAEAVAGAHASGFERLPQR